MGATESVPQPQEPQEDFDIVFVHATWCGPCKRTGPHWDEFVRNYGSMYTTLRVDIDSTNPDTKRYRDLAKQYPTFIVRGVPMPGSHSSSESIRLMLH